MHIGPLDDVERARERRGSPPALEAIRECARGIGDLQIRNLGTIGGSVVHADPASDMPAVLLALGARLAVRSADGARELPIAELLLGPFTTSLGAQELVTDVVVPVPRAGSGSAYASVEHPHRASRSSARPRSSARRRDGGVTGVGATPFLLDGDPATAVRDAEIYGDRFASEEYRRELATVLVERALASARDRAKVDA